MIEEDVGLGWSPRGGKWGRRVRQIEMAEYAGYDRRIGEAGDEALAIGAQDTVTLSIGRTGCAFALAAARIHAIADRLTLIWKRAARSVHLADPTGATVCVAATWR